MGTALLYNLSGDKGRKIRMLCMKQKLKIKAVDPSQYGEKIGALAGIAGMELTGIPYDEDTFADEMMVLVDFSDQTLNRFLSGFKTLKIPRVDLKAVLTETNCQWTSIELHQEIAKEHEQMHGGVK